MLFEDFNYKMYNKFILKNQSGAQSEYSDDCSMNGCNANYLMAQQRLTPGSKTSFCDHDESSLRAKLLRYTEFDKYQHM